jgi:predicted TIM-barrel fold metal-dependent hydrolase
MGDAGVSRAVLVPPSFEGENNDLCVAAAKRFPSQFGVMGRLALDRPDRAAALQTWSETPGALGVRITLFRPAELTALDSGQADWLWAAAERQSMPLMIFPDPTALPSLGQIAEAHPDLRLIIDHLGVAYDPTSSHPYSFENLSMLLHLANYPNIAVKASGLPRYATDSYPFSSTHQVVRDVVRAFGCRRVMWGSDVTSGLSCSYRQSVTMFTEEMSGLSDVDLHWIMGQSLLEWLHWPPAADDPAPQ